MATILSTTADGKTAVVRRRITIRGVVQGVGFRPFVYNLAAHIGIRGFILNTSSGVTIEAEAGQQALSRFLECLQSQAPPLARIQEIATEELPAAGLGAFEIRESQPTAGEFALISPDAATCFDCCREVMDPKDRRYSYPFTNCTSCGPRYTIVRDIPYDRPLTTMSEFRMCPECKAEYDDPRNRRFHAQPNACPACGPTLALVPSGATLPIPDAFQAGFEEPASAILNDVRRLLRQRAIVAIKGLGGFQLACDAENDTAVRLLRRRKKRSDKPFALMARDLASIEKICALSDADRQLLLSPERPIVILRRSAAPLVSLSSAIAPGNDTLGIMLPYTPLHALLFGSSSAGPPEFTALVMTSGNISDEPIVISNDEAWQRLGSVADWFLFHNRDIFMRVDDSVARTVAGGARVLRRSRGYAPRPIDLDTPVCELLACGAELKNAFCLTKDHYAVLSQHIGDVDNYETLEFFRETLANLKKLFRAEPTAVAHDLHPLYLTTRFAQELPLRKIGVQHHHAHVASCMAENGLTGRVIGVAFDGTGYGTDGRIWGGEFLTVDYAGFERQAHLRYVPLPGGDAAVRQPWRSALSWLTEAFPSTPETGTPGWESACCHELLPQVPRRELELVGRMMSRGVNTVLTSSCGRLFDAVAAMIGLRQEITFEGQAAIELETIVGFGIEGSYPFAIIRGRPAQIDMCPAIREIVRDLRNGQSQALIATRFHNTIAALIADVCRRIRESARLNRVCLSGGTFQNKYLLEGAANLLRNLDFEVFLHSRIPPNDGGIALGQAVIANHILNSGA